MPIWPFKRSRASIDAERLLSAVQAASRRLTLFGDGRIPDTLEGRFEALTLHGALALIRIRAEPGAVPLAQDFTDMLFRHFDAGLREAGVGDLTVPKKMRVLASSFFGRLNAYSEALTAKDETAVAGALERNVLGVDGHPFATSLARHALATADTQSAAPLEALFDAEGWPALAA
jgi:cytochrome b pre-mRNA-processing protein 3